MEYLSKERYDEIVAEINFLINEEYPRIKDALAEARAQGDLSENFEYRAARRAGQDYQQDTLPAKGAGLLQNH